MFETMILLMIGLPVAGALYHWASFREELQAMAWVDARNASYVPEVRVRRKAPSKAETRAVLALRSCERKWKRRFGMAA